MLLGSLHTSAGQHLLPAGWDESFDPAHERPFYTNTVSGHRQWERPLYPASELPSGKSVEPPLATGTPVEAGSVAAASDPTAALSSRAEPSFLGAVSTHVAPSHERRAGQLSVFRGAPDVLAPAARAKAAGERWCVLQEGELFVLPNPAASAAEVELKLGMVGVRGVTCPTELQAGAPHALLLDLSPEPRSRQGWLGLGKCVSLVLVADNAQEQQDWQVCLQRVATAYRNYRRVGEAPGAVLDGLKSMGSFALAAAGSGFGWQVGRDAGGAASRAVGLRK